MDKIDNNETKWKTKTFSKDNNNNNNNNNIVENLETITKKHEKNDENKDAEIIIQKIKKINKRKKHANYKNIEELDNIYEDSKIEIKNEKTKQDNNENFENDDEKKTKKDNDENFENDDEKKTKKDNDENFEEIEGFKEDLSNKKCKKNALSDIFSKIRYYIRMLNRLLFGNADNTLSKIIGSMYDLFDKNARSRNGDINIIKNQAYYMLSIPVTLLVTYNWFFITIYKDAGAKINTNIDLESIQSFLPMLKFFLYYLYVPTYLFSNFILNTMPKTIDTAKRFEPMDIVFNSMLLFLLMILILSNIVCNYSSKIKNTLFGYIGGSMKANPSLTNMLYAIILFTMLMSFFPSNPLDTAASLFNLVTAPFSTIFGGLFKLIFTMVNIGIAGIFILSFIIVHSLFAIPIYSNTSFMTTIKNINEFLYQSINNIGKYDCPPNTLDGWIKYLKIFLEIIYRCLYEFIFILFFLIGIFTYLMFVNSAMNKMFFSFINILIITGISFYAYGTKLKQMFAEMKNESM